VLYVCLELQPNVRGWLLACVSGTQKTGLVPANYVKVMGKRRGKQAGESPRPAPAGQSAPLNRPIPQQQSETDLAQQFNAASSVPSATNTNDPLTNYS